MDEIKCEYPMPEKKDISIKGMNPMKLLLKFTYTGLLLIITFSDAFSQMEVVEKHELMDSIRKILLKTYVFPEKAQTIIKELSENESMGKYDSIKTPEQFAFTLTRDLQEITRDQHLKVVYYAGSKNSGGSAPTEKKSSYSEWLKDLLEKNKYGFMDKKVLDGNIGYLDIVLFGPLEYCADSITAAMQLVVNTEALIIDLRSCRGSLDENTIPFMFGYFFKEPVQLSDFYDRSLNFTKQFWSYAWVPGKKYLDRPIYLLTSGLTFSGGEAFTYDLQNLNRAVVIGETTRGGAHPTNMYTLNSSFKINVPYARTINPITKTNWEGTGVLPDSLAPSNKAFYEAYEMAINSLLSSSKDEKKKTELQHVRAGLKEKISMFRKVHFELEGYDQAKEVAVSGSFNFYSQKSLLLEKHGNKWTGTAEVEKGDLFYSFVVDGKLIPDPKNPRSIQGDRNINSVMTVD